MLNSIYDKNGLIFWDENDIYNRNMFVDSMVRVVRENLQMQNKAFFFRQVEAPILTPSNLINANYSKDDYYQVDSDLVLRPETTMGSYEYAYHISSSVRLPMVIWQHGKSFRREQDQVTKNMRLKEFYQLEFQIIFAESTKNDYGTLLIPAIQKHIEFFIGKCRTEESDRLPDYSESTLDIIREENSMEVCSISRRKDCKLGKCLEVAIGTDRIVYNMEGFSK